ncbi:hypothetical protein C8Q80DRAFT_1159511 [Daedaleopsis nitida]|nr:hypothetical protein C8Q80DRAFT_1159511 [Daedaleopsis nitida]
MPRLQFSRRGSLLCTSVRSAFLEALARRTAQDELVCDAAGLGDLARRVQADIQRETGRYFPLHQVVLSMHDLKRDPEPQSLRESSPDVPQIEVTSPQLNSSMSRRRMERNIPALRCQLAIPPPIFTSSLALTPTSETPSRLTPTSTFFSNMPRRNSGARSLSPITPIGQILHTPPTPPRLPRFVPPAPRTWARLNVQARMGESSPLDSPGLPLTPYMLNPTGKPFLKPLQIPSSTMASGDRELLDNLSPLTLSSLEGLPKCSFSGSALQSAVRPKASRTNSASTLARTALLRTAHPAFARRGSFNERPQDGKLGGELERVASPLTPFAASSMSGQALASPFAIHPEAMDGSYFYRA